MSFLQIINGKVDQKEYSSLRYASNNFFAKRLKKKKTGHKKI